MSGFLCLKRPLNPNILVLACRRFLCILWSVAAITKHPREIERERERTEAEMKRLFLRLNLIFGTFVFGSLEIKWSRPRATQSGSDYSNFANNPGEFIRLHKLVAFSVCDNLEMAFNSFAIFEWHFTRVDRSFDFFRDPRIDERFSSFNETKINRLCSTTWQAPAEGTYQVDITVINPNAVNLPLKGSAVFTVKDVWMVILGDSYSSGKTQKYDKIELTQDNYVIYFGFNIPSIQVRDVQIRKLDGWGYYRRSGWVQSAIEAEIPMDICFTSLLQKRLRQSDFF